MLNDIWEDEIARPNEAFTELEPSQVGTDRRAVFIGKQGELAELNADEVAEAYQDAKRRVIILDWGGTLVEQEGMGKYIKSAFGDEAQQEANNAATERMISNIAALASHPNTTVYIISGMDAETLGNSAIAAIDAVGLSAENGVLMSWSKAEGKGKPPRSSPDATRYFGRTAAPVSVSATGGTATVPIGSDSALSTSRQWQILNGVEQDLVRVCLVSTEAYNPCLVVLTSCLVVWLCVQAKLREVKEKARRIMERYRSHVAGSRVVEGPFSISWNFRCSDPDWGQAQSEFLLTELHPVVDGTVAKVSTQ